MKVWSEMCWVDVRFVFLWGMCMVVTLGLSESTSESYDLYGASDEFTVAPLDLSEADECPKDTYNRTCCNHGEFQCADGHCIPYYKLCDGKLDCPDLSDEEGCLSGVSCARRVHSKCEQRCRDLPGNSSRCLCYKGYALQKSSSKLTCVDINECAIGVHWCSQDCENLNGTFGCSCKDGFVKEADGFPGTCKATDQNIQILYSSDAWIYSYSVSKHKVSPVVHAGRVDEMDFDPAANMVYWSTRHRVGRSYLPGAKGGNVTVGHPQAIGPSSIWHTKNSLAIDWTARNLYWISVDILNVDKYQILVSKLDGRYVKTLTNDVMFASSLVVDPEHGKMYWTSGGEKAEIGSAWMNGMYRKTLISLVKSNSPTALTLDHMSSGRLYWSDSKTSTIYSVYTDGTRSEEVIKLGSSQRPLMMDVFENYLYWVTAESRQLVKHDKFGRGSIIPLVEHLINQTAVRVYHPRRVDVEIRRAALYCRNQCSHLCLHVPRGYSCSCPDGSRLLLQRGEILCDAEDEEALEDPLVCDCNDTQKLCNASLPQHRCHCVGVKCEDGVTQSSDYTDITASIDYPEATDSDGLTEGGSIIYMGEESLWPKIIIFILCVIPVSICFALSFCKRPETRANELRNSSRSVCFDSEEGTVGQGYAQGGPTVVKSSSVVMTRNNGVDNPLFQGQEAEQDFMSSTQLLVP